MYGNLYCCRGGIRRFLLARLEVFLSLGTGFGLDFCGERGNGRGFLIGRRGLYRWYLGFVSIVFIAELPAID